MMDDSKKKNQRSLKKWFCSPLHLIGTNIFPDLVVSSSDSELIQNLHFVFHCTYRTKY